MVDVSSGTLGHIPAAIVLEMKSQKQTSDTANLSPLAVSALLKGRKVEAIKIVRKERGIDLKEAKDVVEAYIQSDPQLKATIQRAGKGSGVGWVLLILGAAILAWYFLTNLDA